jgi:tetratricopeptide (TPR) repeat protein
VAGSSARGSSGSGTDDINAWKNALAAWETVLTLTPGHPKALAERLECLIRLKRWDEALRAYEAAEPVLEIEDRTRLARKLMAGGEYEKALQLWQHLVGQAAFHEDALTAIRGQLQCFAKLGLTNQRPLVDKGVLQTSSSGEMARHYESRTTNCNPRHVSILGVSYCGSTLLSLVLGALPCVANVGESHWLLEPRPGKSTNAYNLTSEGFEQCVWCGADCPVVTDDLRRRLADQPQAFYQILGDAHAAEIIVSADKNYPHVVRRDPGLHNDAIIAFRHPLRNWRSHARRNGRTDDAARLKYLERWAMAYTNFLDNFPNTGAKILVDFDDFLINSEKVLKRLCFALNLPFSAEALRYWSIRQHCVGGNREVRQSLAGNDTRALEIAPREASPARFWRSTDPDLPSEITRVYQRLRRQALF